MVAGDSDVTVAECGMDASPTALHFATPLRGEYHVYFHSFLFLSLFLPILMYRNLILTFKTLSNLSFSCVLILMCDFPIVRVTN